MMHVLRRADSSGVALFVGLVGLASLITFQPVAARETPSFTPATYAISAGPNVRYELQSRLIQAVPGDIIELEAGLYKLDRQIDIATDNLTIRGKGSDKTIISFRGQMAGGYGIESTGNNFVIEGLAIEDTSGNAIKVLGARNVTFRDVRTEWTGEAKASNGAYGIYPVQCQNVLIENCTAIGASDAGIYVGQCRQVVVRTSRAERNVAGIEIENTVGADVYENVATNNAGGILVFDLPGLQLKAGRNVRVFRNRVFANNHKNFAAPGNIVAGIPPGTGMMVMATDHVEIFENEIVDNQTSSVSVLSYLISGKRLKDEQFDPYPEAISIHDNRIRGGGNQPSGEIGKLLKPVIGDTFPDILYDGAVNSQKLVDGKLPKELRLSFYANGANTTFVNFNLLLLTPENVANGKYRAERDASPYTSPKVPLTPIELAKHDPPSSGSDQAVRVYRSAPQKLSEHRLFEENGSSQTPVAGVVPYDLNTTLFSDYTTKRRFLRIPAGEKAEYRENGVLQFPVGTLIAKTFSYPHDMRDSTKGERLLETRIEVLNGDGWFGYSYLWNDEQTEAYLSLGGSELDVTWIHTDGATRNSKYQIPNPNQCLNCHSQNKKYVPIGPVAGNMNRDFHFPDGKENQLAFLARKGLLQGLPDSDDLPTYVSAFDPHSGSVADRARTWLDVNCAHCHSPSGTARTSGLDLRLSQQDKNKLGIWKSPVAAGHGSGGREYDVVPGKPDESILLYRIESEDLSIMMPNVSRSQVPKEAASLIREWILKM